MSTVRSKQREQAAEAKKLKKVVKPVLSSPFSLQWPDLSNDAKTQVEAALTIVLMPLVEARVAVYKPKDVSDNNDIPMEDQPQEPVASTSALPAEATEPPTHPHPKWTKRQIRLAKRMTRLERTPGAQRPAGSHDVHLRSGKVVTVPNHAIPEKFFPSMLLNKAAALDARPAICDHLVVGVNAVTRALEEEIEDARRGVVGKPAVTRDKARVQDSLRCFIPAPNFSTRKQRREVRNALHRDEKQTKTKKRKAMDGQIEETKAAMPENMTNIPRGDVVLLLTLEEILADLATAPTGGEADSKEVLLSIIRHIKGEVERDAPSNIVTYADHVAQSTTISIPTKLISKLVGEAAVIDPQARSIFTSLLMRHDPSWFASRNKLASLESLRREAEEEVAATLPAGKRKWGFERIELSATGEPVIVGTTTTKVKEDETQRTVSILGVTKPISLVFVAKDDINPIDIVTHILTAVTARNSINTALRRRTVRLMNRGKARDEDKPAEEKGVYSFLQPEDLNIPDILLVPLPKGAEARLAELLGIRRVSVLAFTHNQIAEFDQLRRLVESHLPEAPHADWLVPASNYLPPIEDIDDDIPGRHLPTSIKHLQTHAPADLKAAKAAKKEAKQARKENHAAGGHGDTENVLIATQL